MSKGYPIKNPVLDLFFYSLTFSTLCLVCLLPSNSKCMAESASYAYEEGFEATSKDVFLETNCIGYSEKVVSTPAREGLKALQISFNRKGAIDTDSNCGLVAHLQDEFGLVREEQEHSFSFSLQFSKVQGEKLASTPGTIRFFDLRKDTTPEVWGNLSTNNSSATLLIYRKRIDSLGNLKNEVVGKTAVSYNTWIDLAISVYRSAEDTGYVKAYVNGQAIGESTGAFEDTSEEAILYTGLNVNKSTSIVSASVIIDKVEINSGLENNSLRDLKKTATVRASVPTPQVYFSKELDKNSRNVIAYSAETLYGKVLNLSEKNALACYEITNLPIDEEHGKKWCADDDNWSEMKSQDKPGETIETAWTFKDGIWRLTANPTRSLFQVGKYRYYWKNSETNKSSSGSFTVTQPLPTVYFSKEYDKNTKSVNLLSKERLYGKVINLTADNAESCFEIQGLDASEEHGAKWCKDSDNWTVMPSTDDEHASAWKYKDGVWRLDLNPVKKLFKPGRYKYYWKNTETGKQLWATFRVTQPAPKVYLSKALDGVTTSVSLTSSATLYGKAINLDEDNAKSCLEILSRPSAEENGKGYCKDPDNYTSMKDNGWTFEDGIWRLKVNPVIKEYSVGSYRLYCINTDTDKSAYGALKVTAKKPVVYFSKTVDGTTTSVSLDVSDPLYGKVVNVGDKSAKSCLEVTEGASSEENGEGYCDDEDNWTTMPANGWSYSDNAWKLAVNPVSKKYSTGNYKMYWKDTQTGQKGYGSFNITAKAPVVYFSKTADGTSTSVSLNSNETLYGKVLNLTSSNAQACLEVAGRTSGNNREGWCDTLSNWTTMPANGWSYSDGVFRLTISPVSNTFPAGTYRGYWRNTQTGDKALASFTVASQAPLAYFSKTPDGDTTSVTLNSSETLYGKVLNLSNSNAQACLEVVGRTSGTNSEGWCNNLSNWTTMPANGWTYSNGVFRLTISPVSNTFPAGSYRGYWRNTQTGEKALATFTIASQAPLAYFSKTLDGDTTSVTLTSSETLYGKVLNLSNTNAQACLEVVGRTSGINSEGWCNNLSNWTTMPANGWTYNNGVFRLTISPVSNTFPAGSYRGYWRNTQTGEKALATFTIASQAPLAYFSKTLDGDTTSVTLTSNETLYGKVLNLSNTNAQACLEVVGRTSGTNSEGWCNNLSNWTTMPANGWTYSNGVFRLTISPVSSTFPTGSYRGYWRNTQTGEKALATFTIVSG